MDLQVFLFSKLKRNSRLSENKK